MDLAKLALIISVLNLAATVILVGITAWYACSAAKMLSVMRGQADVGREQSMLMLKSVEVSAWTGLINAAGHPAGQAPIPKLRELVQELEALEARRI